MLRRAFRGLLLGFQRALLGVQGVWSQVEEAIVVVRAPFLELP